ncbi:putative Major pollen allergen Ory s 1 precursor [Tripterygium wilfordii]|uniref:Putative Major pollen allergen Ory s 1 n=1 Tax=Tripterygium wilfordii TaxID=458696 RepID=A0A7J7CM67_TRIWF|nr:expansin-like B1 [Tripterygium wilfordii]KAF5735118.1 putative Major pollen allergen Ory s 1 precursor [Tripterygium wilfordii]
MIIINQKMGSDAALTFAYFIFICIVVVFPPPSYSAGDTFTHSRATYHGSPDGLGTPTGACGFGEYGRTVNDGKVAGVSRLFRAGRGCGACYQVRCKAPYLCSDDGVEVVATDYGEGDHTDFIMSPTAFSRMGYNPTASHELFAYGVVDVEFQRIPCRGYGVLFKIHEQTRYPHYLAIVILSVAGKSDVVDVDFWDEERNEWSGMRRPYGAVFDTTPPPKSTSIKLRFHVSGSEGLTWLEAPNAIPSGWKLGATYQSNVNLN